MGTYLPKSTSLIYFVCAKSHITPNLLTWKNVVREAHTGLIRSTYTTRCNSCVEISKCWYWIAEFYWLLSVCLSVRLSGIEKTQILNVGNLSRVPTWSFLSVVRPLQIPIPMCKKKIWVQQENLWKLTYCLRVLPTYFLHYTHRAWMGWRNLSKTAEKSSSSPRAVGVFPRVAGYFPRTTPT